MEDSFWKKIIKSFNPNFYREIASQSLGQSFKYLLFLFLLLTFLLSFVYTIGFSGKIKEFKKALPDFFAKLKEFPEITIEKGKIIFPKESFLKEWKEFVFVVDPQREISYYLDFLKNYKGGLIIINDNLIIKNKEKTEIQDISKINFLNIKFGEKEKLFNFTFNGQTFQPTFKEINSWLNIISFLFFPICFIFIFFGFWTIKVIQIFGLSILSLIVNKFKKLNLNYSALLNIGIFALTPPLILETLIRLSGMTFPQFGFIYYSLYIIFLLIGISKCKKYPEEKLV